MPVLAFLLAFNVAYGATPTREDLLKQLIGLLIQQVQLLTEQLNMLKQSQVIATSTPLIMGAPSIVETPVQNVIINPVITQATNTLTELNKMQIDIIEESSKVWRTTDTVDNSTVTAVVKTYYVFLDDTNGQPLNGSITISGTPSKPATVIYQDETTKTTQRIGVPGRREGQGAVFGAKFWANGNYTITFTSGDTTKSVDVSINEL